VEDRSEGLRERFVARHYVRLELAVVGHGLRFELPLPLQLLLLLPQLRLELLLGLLSPLLALELEANGFRRLSSLDRLDPLVQLSEVRDRQSLELVLWGLPKSLLALPLLIAQSELFELGRLHCLLARNYMLGCIELRHAPRSEHHWFIVLLHFFPLPLPKPEFELLELRALSCLGLLQWLGALKQYAFVEMPGFELLLAFLEGEGLRG